MNGYQFSDELWGKLKVQVMHVSPQTMLFHMQCHGPSSVHAELRRTADIMASVRCVSSATSSDRRLDRLGRRGGGFSASAVIQQLHRRRQMGGWNTRRHRRAAEPPITAEGRDHRVPPNTHRQTESRSDLLRPESTNSRFLL